MPKSSISVVIPAYKAARTVAATLDSVLAQTRPPDEIIVVDDGSPDDTSAVLKSYEGRIRMVRQPNSGASKARNKGIEHATGRFIAFIDADDLWAPTKLEQQLEVFHRHPEVGLVSSRFYFTGRPEDPKHTCPDDAPPMDQVLRPSGEYAFEVATKCWTSSIMVRREVLGSNRFTSGLEPAEDRDLWVRLIVAAPMYMISQPLATAVGQPGSLSRGNVEVERGNMLRVVQRYAQLLGPEGLRRWETTVYKQWAALYLARHQPEKAVIPAWQRLRHDPLSVEGWWVLVKSVAWSYAAARHRRTAAAAVAAGRIL